MQSVWQSNNTSANIRLAKLQSKQTMTAIVIEFILKTARQFKQKQRTQKNLVFVHARKQTHTKLLTKPITKFYYKL